MNRNFANFIFTRKTTWIQRLSSVYRTKSRDSKSATQRERIELRQVLTQIAAGESKSKKKIFICIFVNELITYFHEFRIDNVFHIFI